VGRLRTRSRSQTRCLSGLLLQGGACARLSIWQEMRAFWLPSKTPEAKALLDKPDMSTRCPATGKKLKLKDLVAVRFTRAPEEEEGRYTDPVTRETFTNSSALVVLKPTGGRPQGLPL
jgi:hypothetical protein